MAGEGVDKKIMQTISAILQKGYLKVRLWINYV